MTPEIDSKPGLFQELMPMVKNRTVMITVAALDEKTRICQPSGSLLSPSTAVHPAVDLPSNSVRQPSASGSAR